MAKFTTTLVANGTADLGYVHKRVDDYLWAGLVFAYGTWGGGTLAFKWSPDGGTTKINLPNTQNTAVSFSADNSARSDMLTGKNQSDKIKIYAVLTGATSPSLTIGYYDNN